MAVNPPPLNGATVHLGSLPASHDSVVVLLVSGRHLVMVRHRDRAWEFRAAMPNLGRILKRPRVVKRGRKPGQSWQACGLSATTCCRTGTPLW